MNNNMIRRHNDNGPMLIEDKSASNILKSALIEARQNTLKYFSRDMIICESFIFKISDDVIDLYPHKLCDKLQLGYDDDDNEKITGSQLLKLYLENKMIITTYQQYINLPSVIPITLPIIYGNKLNSDVIFNNDMLSHAFIVRNWMDLGCTFPLNVSYMDLLLNIGGNTSIKVIDNITNLNVEDDMKLYEWSLYTVGKLWRRSNCGSRTRKITNKF